MQVPKIFIISALLVLLSFSSSVNAQKTVGSPSLTPTPAPAPAPDYVNLTDLLTVAGPFHTFLSYLQQTKVIDTFQNQANNTEEDATGTVGLSSGWTTTKVSSSVHSTDPVAVYQIDRVLIPQAIFGTPPPPSPAPAPSPDIAPVADSPTEKSADGSSPKSSVPSSSHKIIMNYLFGDL
ncbi:hypothetical protein BVC80_1785g21 [Macleaya cordata]|uniref:FAS1 domain n=1 Tax=Macleaya cordata TaxID=56857 RepID=A0A200QFH9_MACCD|nr:hypothetical protein BVC80_1785g21 [Macleaya cordata]